MGFMRTGERLDLVNNLARSVCDRSGKFLGSYFPASRSIRSVAGQRWDVGDDGCVRSEGRVLGRLDQKDAGFVLDGGETH
jgi:hypothetical protein